MRSGSFRLRWRKAGCGLKWRSGGVAGHASSLWGSRDAFRTGAVDALQPSRLEIVLDRDFPSHRWLQLSAATHRSCRDNPARLHALRYQALLRVDHHELTNGRRARHATGTIGARLAAWLPWPLDYLAAV